MSIPLPVPSDDTRARSLTRLQDRLGALLECGPTALEPLAGAPLAIDISSNGATLGIRVVHLGQGLDAPGREALERSLTAELGRPASLSSVALPSAELTRAEGELRFIAELAPALQASMSIAEVSVCAEQPPPVTGRRRVGDEAFATAVRALLAEHPRVTLSPGMEWRVRFSLAPCPPATADGSVEAAAPARP